MSILDDTLINNLPKEDGLTYVEAHEEQTCIQRFGLPYVLKSSVNRGYKVDSTTLEIHPLVSDSIKQTVELAQPADFVGTQAAWEQLTLEEKAKFDSSTGASVQLVDDFAE